MRHGKKVNHLSRKSAHRKSMLANMSASLIKHKKINTTLAKAKVLRTFIEPLITKAKSDTTQSRRTVFRYLKDKFAVNELFRDVAPKIINRQGGYTRILKTVTRMGDNSKMCFIELVDFNEAMLAKPKPATEKKPRTRRGGTKKSAEAAPSKPPASKSKPDSSGIEDAVILSASTPAEDAAKAEKKSA